MNRDYSQSRIRSLGGWSAILKLSLGLRVSTSQLTVCQSLDLNRRRRFNQFAATPLSRTLGQEGLGTLQREFRLLPLDDATRCPIVSTRPHPPRSKKKNGGRYATAINLAGVALFSGRFFSDSSSPVLASDRRSAEPRHGSAGTSVFA